MWDVILRNIGFLVCWCGLAALIAFLVGFYSEPKYRVIEKIYLTLGIIQMVCIVWVVIFLSTKDFNPHIENNCTWEQSAEHVVMCGTTKGWEKNNSVTSLSGVGGCTQ